MVIGVVTGSIFYMKIGEGRTAVNERLSDIFRIFAGTENRLEAAENFFFGKLALCLIIFVSAYFRAGAAVTAAAMLRRGFVMGFTGAAAAGAYGVKGALIMAASGMDMVAGTVILVIFSAISASYSIEREKNSKKFLIFSAIFSISIFCMISLSRGFVSTTFMKLLYPKLD